MEDAVAGLGENSAQLPEKMASSCNDPFGEQDGSAPATAAGKAVEDEDLPETIRKLREELELCQQGRQHDVEEMRRKMGEVRDKAKEHIRQLQEKMQQAVQVKESAMEELEAEKARVLAELAEERARAGPLQQEREELASQLALMQDRSQEAGKEALAERAALEAQLSELRCQGQRAEGEALDRQAELDSELAALRSQSQETLAELAAVRAEEGRVREEARAREERAVEAAREELEQLLRARHGEDLEAARQAEARLRSELREQEEMRQAAPASEDAPGAAAAAAAEDELRVRLRSCEEECELARAAEGTLREELAERERRIAEAAQEEREGQPAARQSDDLLQDLRSEHQVELQRLQGVEQALRRELEEQEARAAETLQEREGQLEALRERELGELRAWLEADVEAARGSEEALRSELQQHDRRATEAQQEREAELAGSSDGLLEELRERQRLQAEEARSLEESLRSELRELDGRCSQALEDLEAARRAEGSVRAELEGQEARASARLAETSQQSESASDDLARELRERFQQELAAAEQAEGALRSQLGEQEALTAEAKEELGQLQSKSEAKIGEIVKKAKDFSRQMQTRLESSVAENRELTEKCREADEAQRQQQDEATKYKQLNAVANSRIEESDRRAKELMDALSRSQAQRTALLEQAASVEKSLTMPPSKEELERRGGVQLAVEGDDDDVWCLLKDSATAGAEDGSGEARAVGAGRWWKLSQLEVSEKPVALQKRWRGEVSALRAQMQRFKRKGEEAQEEFESYKQKANAALQTGASHCEEIQLKTRQVEQLGEQLRAATLDVQRAQEDKARAQEDLSETRRRLQETLAKGSELEKVLERRAREGEERCFAEVASCRSAFEAQREQLELQWSERERAFQQEIDLRRAQKESLDEEVEGLRAMLAHRGAAVLETEQSLDDGGAAASSSAGPVGAAVARGSADAAAPPPPPPEPPAARAASPPESADGAAARPEGEAPSESGSRRSPRSTPRTFEEPEGEADATASAQQVLPQPDSSYHASVTWEGIVKLRSQVRQLEISLQEERQQHGCTRREREAAKAEVREMNMQQSLSNTVGQRQQMEYIRNVFRKFIETCPLGSAEHEQMIFVLMTFFKFPDDDAKAVNKKRLQAKSQGGLWGTLTGWKG